MPEAQVRIMLTEPCEVTSLTRLRGFNGHRPMLLKLTPLRERRLKGEVRSTDPVLWETPHLRTLVSENLSGDLSMLEASRGGEC